MPTVKEVVKEITSARRRNDLEARRRKLGLSRVALGRILDVDPATVFRRERGPLVRLWDYAMRGIEAEAKKAKPILRSHKGDLDLQTKIPRLSRRLRRVFTEAGTCRPRELVRWQRPENTATRLTANPTSFAPSEPQKRPVLRTRGSKSIGMERYRSSPAMRTGLTGRMRPAETSGMRS